MPSWAPRVLALFSDSTNADRRGFTGSERDVIEAFEEIFSSAAGKIVVTAFSTSVYRLQLISDLANQFGRKVAFVGRGMQQTSQIADRLGHLRLPGGIQIRESEVKDYPAQDVVCLCTGSQGEPLAALPRIAIDDHRHVRLAQSDVVVFSARAIPGNEKAIACVMNHIARRGADGLRFGSARPRVRARQRAGASARPVAGQAAYFVPIHGEHRQLARHAAWLAWSVPARKLMAEDGDVLRFDGTGASVADRVPAGRILIDGTRTGEIADEVLRDRRHLAGTGSWCWSWPSTGRLAPSNRRPKSSLGVWPWTRSTRRCPEAPELLARAIESASPEERTDPGLLKERIRVELQRLFRKRAGRRPLVLPVVMEVRRMGRNRGENRLADSFVSRRLSEFAGVASFAAGLIWLISLASYTPTDPAWFFNDLDSTAVANFAGRVGAFLAEASFQIAGYSAFLGPVILGVVGWNYFWCKKINASYTKLVGATLLVGCVAALLSLASSVFETGDRQFSAGGAIGDWIAAFCSSFLNGPARRFCCSR